MIKTTFKLHVYILPILTIAIPILLYKSFQEGGFSPDLPIYMKLFVCSLLICTFIYLLFGELRTKALRLEINNNSIVVKKYLGFGVKKSFDFKNLDGYALSDLYSYGGFYEYLYIIKGDKKIIKISEFHHSNYINIKKVLNDRLDFKGKIKFKMLDELAEIFK